MKYPALSFKNQKLLKKLRDYGDSQLVLTNDDYPTYKESDIYELIECGYLRCKLPEEHSRSFSDIWTFVGFITYTGHTYYRGRAKSYLKRIGHLGGWIASAEIVFNLLKYLL